MNRLGPAILASLCCGLLLPGFATAADDVDFARDIRPILSASCFECHGPDAEHREADLRLDLREGAFADRGDSAVIVPGKPDQSEVVRRITSSDPLLRMPPADSGKTLSAEQIGLIKRWIQNGAKWSEHWAFVPPQRPELPEVQNRDWIRNPIDAFILARLEQEGLRPSPEADKTTLLRRLSLDLIGLPPTIAEVEAFLAETSPRAYERQIERLLESPHHGERWARWWLDAARYADSDGFEKDKPRDVWFYRDWVIHALNRDLPYDQFIIEQIAGDMLPNPTQDQLVATGFLRNSMLNEEGGIDPEQFRVEAMFDRMDAVGTAILGLTIKCSQCHSHKYDPLTQTEYYQMFAFLNNSHEASIVVYTPKHLDKRRRILKQIEKIEEQIRRENPHWRKRMAEWEAEVRDSQPEWTVLSIENAGDHAQRYKPYDDHSLRAEGYAPTRYTGRFRAQTDQPEIRSFRLEMLTDPNLPAGGPGRSVDGLFALTEFKVQVADARHPEKKEWVTFKRATADFSNEEQRLGPKYADRQGNRGLTGPIEFAIDDKDETAWGIDAGPGRRNQSRKAVFVAEKNVAFPEGTELTFHLVQKHGGWNSDDNQNMNLGRFRISVTGAENAEADPLPRAVRQILQIPPEQRTEEQVAQVFRYWRTTIPEWQAANDRIEALWQDHPAGATQLVLKERDEPRPTHLLERGEFLKPGEQVSPGVPAFLHDLPPDAPRNRLTFARWLVDRQSPMTARALVNRVWQAYFGTGLVQTSEDFGSQADAPSHPELLDWLAVEFMDSGWSLKHLHRLIVNSSTYRQSSRVTPELQDRDPYNRLLARGPRFRVTAEIVRDIALAASGLLNREMGGPSIQPPAPEFLFQPPSSYGPKTWEVATGSDRYRRAIYTFRYRSVPYPALRVFDAPTGEAACVRRTRSNTPLQALTTLNETLFVECARSLAQRTLEEGGSTNEDRLAYAFRRCLARQPTAKESGVLLGFLNKQFRRFAEGDLKPWQLAANAPQHPPELPEGTTPAELAAWTALSRVLLNLDETITKE